MNLKNLLIVSRANIQVASLPTAVLGIALAARHWSDLYRLDVFLFIVLFFLILTFSCHVNCLHDQDVDAKYKEYMSHAVRQIGIARLKKWIRCEAIFSIAIIVALAVMKQQTIYLSAVGALLCGYAYSARPFRVKKRGILSPLPVLLGLYFLPPVAGWYLIRGKVSGFIFIFAFGYSILMEGITFINTCEDFAEDQNSDIRTLAHVAGIRTTLKIGTAAIITGSILDILSLACCKYNELSRTPLIIILTMLLGLFFISQTFRIAGKFVLISQSIDPEYLSKQYAQAMPFWFFKTRYPLLAITLLAIG
ncbi:MAG TPA: UbiA family prenyltransferase [Acidobacteriota bacterium]